MKYDPNDDYCSESEALCDWDGEDDCSIYVENSDDYFSCDDLY